MKIFGNNESEEPVEGKQEIPRGGVLMTPDQIRELLVSVVAEMKKPTAQEQEKLDKETEQKRRDQIARVEVGRAEEQRRKSEQARCSHLRPDGKPRTGGQLHSDGKVHIFCLGCQKEVNVYTPGGYEISQLLSV